MVQNVRVDGLCGRVYASAHSAPEPVFVLLHGIGMSHRYLARLQRELAKVGAVYSFDLPGFGATPKPPGAVSVRSYARFVEHLLDRRGIGSCVLVGHSMGVQFAIELATQRPDLVSHLVLIGPVVDRAHRTVGAQALALGLDCLLEPLSVNAIVLTDYLRCGPRWYLKELPEMMSYPTEDRIAGVQAPVLVVRGGNDPAAGEAWCRYLVERARAARLLQVPGRAHVVQHSASALVAGSVVEFIGNIVPRWPG